MAAGSERGVDTRLRLLDWDPHRDVDRAETVAAQLVHLFEPEVGVAIARIDQILIWRVRPALIAENGLPERNNLGRLGRARNNEEALHGLRISHEAELARRARY